MNNLKTICVIGSNSFSGASFCAHLLKKGYRVIGVSRSDEPHDALLPYKWVKTAKDQFTFYAYDLNKHRAELVTLLKREKVSYIVNFAAQSMVGQSWEHPEHWFQTNAIATTKLFQQLPQLDALEKYVHITTPEVYGSTDGFIKEGTAFNPSTPYAVSRAAGDMSLRAYADAFDIPFCMTRAANVYGPGQPLYRIIPRTALFFRLGKTLNLHGGGVSERSFIHMDDVSDATEKVMLSGKTGDDFHISTNEIVTIRQLVERLADAMGVSFEDHVTVGEERIGKDAAYLLDSNKIRNALNWSDHITLDEGIQKTVAWVDDNLPALKTLPQDYEHKE